MLTEFTGHLNLEGHLDLEGHLGPESCQEGSLHKSRLTEHTKLTSNSGNGRTRGCEHPALI
jgi:hypothetical protein